VVSRFSAFPACMISTSSLGVVLRKCAVAEAIASNICQQLWRGGDPFVATTSLPRRVQNSAAMQPTDNGPEFTYHLSQKPSSLLPVSDAEKALGGRKYGLDFITDPHVHVLLRPQFASFFR
jgi:hypothetical protein